MQSSKVPRGLPVKTVVQVLKLVLYSVATIAVISLIIDQSPSLLLGGLGTMTAVLMLIFKDPILGLVAGIQLSANQMVAPGDWMRNVDASDPFNGRHLTHLGTFRAYVVAYLRNHPMIHQEMTFLVRHLAPTEHGLPIEIYVFSPRPGVEQLRRDSSRHLRPHPGDRSGVRPAYLPESGRKRRADPAGRR